MEDLKAMRVYLGNVVIKCTYNGLNTHLNMLDINKYSSVQLVVDKNRGSNH